MTLSRDEIEDIRGNMHRWSDYGPDPSDTILGLIAHIDALTAAVEALYVFPEPDSQDGLIDRAAVLAILDPNKLQGTKEEGNEDPLRGAQGVVGDVP